MGTSKRLVGLLRASFVAQIALLGAVTTLAGCVIPLTPAELAREENRPYPGRSKAQVVGAAVTALRSMGYEIVVADASAGLIKTAPKLVTTTAQGNQYGAVAVENSLGWTIGVTSIPGGVGLHADPRAYRGGQTLSLDDVNGSYLQKMFDSFYAELDSNLPGGAPQTSGGLGVSGPAR